MTPAEQINAANLLAKVPCVDGCTVEWSDARPPSRPPVVVFKHHIPGKRVQIARYEVIGDDGNVREGWLSEAMAWLASFHEEGA